MKYACLAACAALAFAGSALAGAPEPSGTLAESPAEVTSLVVIPSDWDCRLSGASFEAEGAKLVCARSETPVMRPVEGEITVATPPGGRLDP